MKKILFTLLALAAMTVSAIARPVTVTPKNGSATIEVKNPNNYDLADAIVVLSIDALNYRSAKVTAGSNEIPSQFDVFDDGARELAFVIALKAGESRNVAITFSENEAAADAYPSRTHAQMFLLENRVPVPKDVISAEQDNMYNRLHHHGPAFESELTAYRIYFDRKQTVDIYGKRIPRLELGETLFYPTDEHLANKYGDDVLMVGESLGVGAMKGWDGERSTHIQPMARREARVLATGPVRAIVEMNVEGWEYNGQKLDFSSRYTIYAGHRDAVVRSRFSPNAQGMEFSTGVQKFRNGDVMETNGESWIGDWGRYWPVTDTVKYAMETVGLGVSVPQEYVVKPATDRLNYLYVVKPDANNEIHYRITFVSADKEEFESWTPESFFTYMRRWDAEKPVEITVK